MTERLTFPEELLVIANAECGRLREVNAKLLSGAKDARLMLYAWRGARPASYGDHPELMDCIQKLEAAIAKATSDDANKEEGR